MLSDDQSGGRVAMRLTLFDLPHSGELQPLRRRHPTLEVLP
jgi:hypothetical protein